MDGRMDNKDFNRFFYLEDIEFGDVGAVHSKCFIHTLMLFVVGMVRIRLLLVRTVSSRTANIPFSSRYCYYRYRLRDLEVFWGHGFCVSHQFHSSSICLCLQTPASLKAQEQKSSSIN